MKANVIITPNFQREAKRLMKKYQSLKSELLTLSNELEENPRLGTLVKENTYKIRLAVKSKGKGKSGGMRVITHVEAIIVETDSTSDVYLLSIYDKSDQEDIPDALLENLIVEIQTDIQASKNKLAVEEE